MSPLLIVIISTLFAGLAMALGASIACLENTQKRAHEKSLRHGVTAFGGGALLSAVALVLVPEGIAHTPPFYACLFFILGGMSFMMLDIFLKKINTPASQLAAMLADFIPESLALGAAFATGNNTAFLLAGLIALQNLPEGFSAYHELNTSAHYQPYKVLLLISLMSLFGPIAGVSGYFFLSGSPVVVAAIMLFASGGILYAIFQDIAPQVRLEKHWAPPLGAVLGFMLGMVGLMVTLP